MSFRDTACPAGRPQYMRKGLGVLLENCEDVHVLFMVKQWRHNEQSKAAHHHHLGQHVHVHDSTYGVILRIVKAGCDPVAIAQVVEH